MWGWVPRILPSLTTPVLGGCALPGGTLRDLFFSHLLNLFLPCWALEEQGTPFPWPLPLAPLQGCLVS